METFLKDPDAKLDYAIDWSEWLASGDTISSHEWTVAEGINHEDAGESAGVTTIWLWGGTLGETYTIACKIVTTDGRTDERTFKIQIADR
jgi:hypothetical protein